MSPSTFGGECSPSVGVMTIQGPGEDETGKECTHLPEHLFSYCPLP